LLSIAEAEAGSRRETMAVVDLGEIARSVAELYEPVADEKGLSLVIEIAPWLPVRGDRHLLSQAIANLLDNALKYTAQGSVILRLRRVGDQVRAEIADTGPGVPSERRAAVFDRFVRLEGSRSTPGNGLGLSLVRAVAKLHGGEVHLEDNNPGLRAVFSLPPASERIALPASRSAA
jgi:signal transduction histidine kinase